MNLDSNLFSPEFFREDADKSFYLQSAWMLFVDDDTLEFLFAQGWRRACFVFYRISHEPILGTDRMGNVLPLRLPVDGFKMTKSQQKIYRKNAHFRYQIGNITASPAHEALFARHKVRFSEYVPDTLEVFISPSHDSMPTRGEILDVYDGDRLIASSFLDVTPNAISSIYAMFDPDYNAFSLGVYTMLLEIEYTIRRGSTFWYPGFAHHEPSFYDYKKRFNNLEYFDWETWKPYPRLKDPTEKGQ